MSALDIARMSPEELARRGISVELALRARMEHEDKAVETAMKRRLAHAEAWHRGREVGLRDALAIIEAKR